MKKIYLTLLSVCVITFNTSAQIVINSASGYNPGDSFMVQLVEAGPIFPTNAGANITADYSNAIAIGTPQKQIFVSPVGTPYASTFPTATVVQPTISSQGNSGYSYFRKTSTELNLLGLGTPSYVLNYSNPQLALKFPLSFGDSIRDEFAATFSVNGTNIKRNGIITMKADAWGNVITPVGTQPYLRATIEQEIDDSVFIGTDFIQILQTYSETFNYFGSNYTVPLFSYSGFVSSGGSSESAFYLLNPANSVASQNSQVIQQAKVFPNPVNGDKLYLGFDMLNGNNVKVLIMDMNGKVHMENPTVNYKAGKYELVFDLSNMAGGIYNLVMQSENGNGESLRFVIP